MDEILRAIPHRAPFLFVDRIVERASDALVTEWTVSPDAPFLRGHYPGFPIVPGVLICEFAFQSGALLCAQESGADGTSVPVLARIGDARFKKRVGPGEVLRCTATLTERVGPARYLRAHVTSGADNVLKVEFVVMFAPVELARAAPAGSDG